MKSLKFLISDNNVITKAVEGAYIKGVAYIDGIFYSDFTTDNSEILELPYSENKEDLGVYDQEVFQEYQLNDREVVGIFTKELKEDCKETHRKLLQEERDRLISQPINGVAVSTSSYREDIKEYAELLSVYSASTPEEQASYAGMVNSDGTISWILADNTTRDVSEAELRETYQQYFVRKGVLMGKYKAALTALYDPSVTTSSQIEAIDLV